MKRITANHNMICTRCRQDTTMAMLLFYIVLMFVLCHSIKLGLNIYEGFQVNGTFKMNDF